MMQVKTYIDKSKIKGAGIGLFAGEYIKKGTVTWRLDTRFDIMFLRKDYKSLDKITMSCKVNVTCA